MGMVAMRHTQKYNPNSNTTHVAQISNPRTRHATLCHNCTAEKRPFLCLPAQIFSIQDIFPSLIIFGWLVSAELVLSQLMCVPTYFQGTYPAPPNQPLERRKPATKVDAKK